MGQDNSDAVSSYEGSVSGNDALFPADAGDAGYADGASASVPGIDMGGMDVSGNSPVAQFPVDGGSVHPLEVYMESPMPVPLWDSDIDDYSVTDGLLLCILLVLMFDVFLHNGRRR